MSSGRKSLGWIFQVITAVILVVAVLAHLLRVHIWGSYKGLPTYQDVIAAFKNPLVLGMELVLAGAAIYHALYGLHMVLVEANLVKEEKSRKILAILGSAMFIYALILSIILAIKP